MSASTCPCGIFAAVNCPVHHRPKRVLHVVRAMDRGGVETWLMHVLRKSDPRLLQMDFLVHTDTASAYDEEIIGRGCRLIPCTVPWRSPFYGPCVRSLLRGFGPYDAVHSHVHYFSGVVLGLAKGCGVPMRIAHSHTDSSREDLAGGWLRRRYLHFARAAIGRYATDWLAASKEAGYALFGEEWGTDGRSHVLHCGIDLDPFRRRLERDQVRTSLHIGADEVVIGQVGRFDPLKNHSFALDVAAEFFRKEPRLRLLLVGDGPNRPSVEKRLRSLGIDSRTTLLGSRPDVPNLLAAMDVFLFPSVHEGLGLALVEAQAAGLQCLISDSIPAAADVLPALVHRLPLAAGASAWAEVLATIVASPLCDRERALGLVENSSFNIERSLQRLYAFYRL
jgi:glycosyltransferase involved in cell wall biosynthesis